ncbi:hypothetical protein pEaSNUABM44_00220 [Erwinia phage pEa_SNUABM_44]|nr:hypothetical protein pEaSNUABM44_00220 [Erwinia phage pEa_SNUABM_44]
MYNIKTDIKVDGDVEFTGELIGNIPGAKVSKTGNNLISINSNNELTTTLKTFGVNLPTNQSSNISSPRAHIIQGSNEIFKITIGDDYFDGGGPYPSSTNKMKVLNAYLSMIPCDDNNNFLPYNITTYENTSIVNGIFCSTLVSIIFIQGIATKLFNVNSNTYYSRSDGWDVSYVIDYFITTSN